MKVLIYNYETINYFHHQLIAKDKNFVFKNFY